MDSILEDQSIIRGFGILYRTFVKYMSKSIGTEDISFSDSIFLVNIGEKEGTSQDEIATALAIDKAAVARSVKNLTQRGYVLARQSPYDKRAKELYLSRKGNDLFHDVMKLHETWLKSVLAGSSPGEIHDFAQMIDKISSQAKGVVLR
jgi:DNA-binding MarR family transcriptional regulator